MIATGTRIKMCGLRRAEDIRAANAILPEYIGFVFFRGSRRYLSPEEAAALRGGVAPEIRVVGVFVDEEPEQVAALMAGGIIDIAQLHGQEDEAWLRRFRALGGGPAIRAFRVRRGEDIRRAEAFPSDMILLDAGAGDGKTFDWRLLQGVMRPYFLAGGLNPENAGRAVRELTPFAVDVSSGIETAGFKDPEKMRAFARAVRMEGEKT